MITIKRKQYIPAPDGISDAVCVDAHELGLVQTPFGEKEQVKITWELDKINDEGRRYLISKNYNRSLADKSTLFRDCTAWSGGLSAEDLNNFDLETFIGLPCRLLIIHKPSKDGRIFANIDRVLKSGDVKLEASGNYMRLKDRAVEKCIDAALLK